MATLEALSPAQRKVYDAICIFMRSNKLSPTYQELANITGAKSANGIVQTLERLQRKGWIKLTPHKSRSIKLTHSEHVVAEGIVQEVPVFDESEELIGLLKIGNGMFTSTPDQLIKVTDNRFGFEGVISGDLVAVKGLQDEQTLKYAQIGLIRGAHLLHQ